MNKTKVPFSWENKPGVCKEMVMAKQQQHPNGGGGSGDNLSSPKLPPPPCQVASGRLITTTTTTKVDHDDLQIPLPPCAFQPPPPSRSASRKGLMMMNMKHQDQDPFLLAFRECTRNGNKLAKKNSKGMFNYFSCKRSCSVRDDNLVRVSQLSGKKDGDLREN